MSIYNTLLGQYKNYSDEPPVPPTPGPDYTEPFYVEDISGSDNTLSIKKSNSSAPTLTIEKSLDGKSWETMGESSTTAITATVPANGKLYLRCSANAWASYTYPSPYSNRITCSSQFNAGGNIMSLLYGSSFTGRERTFPSGSTYNFSNLFYLATTLVSAENLLLSATTLAQSCYQGMFYNCSSLTTAPSLPATTLTQACYYQMFQYCSSLTTAPSLPATTLGQGCYYAMFSGCSSLTTVPAILPATTLTSTCYQSMFSGCTSLTTAPELPATTLADSCYQGMFYNCSSLTTAPSLPAVKLKLSCYREMFYQCISLTTTPELKAKYLPTSAYYRMFYKCFKITSCRIYAIYTATDAITDMFKSITTTGTLYIYADSRISFPKPSNWTVIEDEETKYGPDKTYFYIEDASGSDNTVTIKRNSTGIAIDVEKSTDGVTWESSTYSPTVPANGKLYLRAVTTAWADSLSTGYNYTITCAGNYKLGGNIASLIYGSDFKGRTYTKATYTFQNLFSNSTTLTDVSKLILPFVCDYRDYTYSNMFYNCTNLQNVVPEIHGFSFRQGSCSGMYHNTAITSIPEGYLYPTSVNQYGCSNMFSYCKGLTEVPKIFENNITATGTYAFASMFSGCSNITQVADDFFVFTGSYNYVCQSMFSGCTALTRFVFARGIYNSTDFASNFFNGCRNLSYIECPNTSVPTSAITNWVRNVAATGTFVKKAGVEWPTGTNGIPSGWTVVEY